MSLLAPADCLPRIESAAADLAAVLEAGELAAPVPACPGWTLTDLAHHVSGVHRWARVAVAERRPGGETLDDPPTERGPLVDWFREGAAELVETLAGAGPDAEAWGFGPKPRTAAFWFRRQLHETSMHAWDARSSQVSRLQPDPGPYGDGDPAVALDGIDEVHGMFFPRQVRLERIPAPTHGVAVEAGDRRWVFGPEDDVVATLAGPADAVLLALWNRLPLTGPGLEVTGDPARLLAGVVP